MYEMIADKEKAYDLWKKDNDIQLIPTFSASTKAKTLKVVDQIDSKFIIAKPRIGANSSYISISYENSKTKFYK